MKCTTLKSLCLIAILAALNSAAAFAGEVTPPVPRPSVTTTVPSDVPSATDQFKAARDAYLTSVKDLTSKLKDASKEQQATIREELRQQREQFKAAAKETSRQQKESLQKLDKDLGRKIETETGGHGRGR